MSPIPSPRRAGVAGLAAALFVLAGCSAPAGDAQPSLYERRLGVIQGQSAGIELLPARKASDAGGTAAAPALPPPTGRSMSDSKKIDSPDHGITLPTGR